MRFPQSNWAKAKLNKLATSGINSYKLDIHEKWLSWKYAGLSSFSLCLIAENEEKHDIYVTIAAVVHCTSTKISSTSPLPRQSIRLTGVVYHVQQTCRLFISCTMHIGSYALCIPYPDTIFGGKRHLSPLGVTTKTDNNWTIVSCLATTLDAFVSVGIRNWKKAMDRDQRFH